MDWSQFNYLQWSQLTYDSLMTVSYGAPTVTPTPTAPVGSDLSEGLALG